MAFSYTHSKRHARLEFGCVCHVYGESNDELSSIQFLGTQWTKTRCHLAVKNAAICGFSCEKLLGIYQLMVHEDPSLVGGFNPSEKY